MSIFTDIRDTGEALVSAVSPFDIRSDRAKQMNTGIAGIANRMRNKETDVLHQITGTTTAAQRREQQNLINSQIKEYKEQTEITKSELARKKNEEAIEKRRIEEKQIRALRRNYRAQGFLGTPSPDSTDMPSKLGT